MKKYLEIGKIVSTQGIKGEVRVQPWCDSVGFICEFDTLYFKKGGEYIPQEIERGREHGNIAVLKIAGVDTPEAAQALRNKILYMNRDDVELSDGSYFVQDLIGLRVIDTDSGEEYGELCDVSETGANDVYHIKTAEGKILLIPAIPQVVIETDIEGGSMKIRPLEGLFDEAE